MSRARGGPAEPGRAGFLLSAAGAPWPAAAQRHLDDATLQAHVRACIAASPAPEIDFAWQGGEPTLAGIAFVEKALRRAIRIRTGDLARTVSARRQRALGLAKTALPSGCERCAWRFACYGGCPKHRIHRSDGHWRNHLCAGHLCAGNDPRPMTRVQ